MRKAIEPVLASDVWNFFESSREVAISSIKHVVGTAGGRKERQGYAPNHDYEEKHKQHSQDHHSEKHEKSIKAPAPFETPQDPYEEIMTTVFFDSPRMPAFHPELILRPSHNKGSLLYAVV